MNKALTWVKAHPVLTGGIVIVLGLAAYMLMSGGGGGSVQYQDTGPSDTETAANMQLQLAQLSAGLQGQQLQQQAISDANQIQAQLKLAEMSATYNNRALDVQAALGNAQIQASRDATRQGAIGNILSNYLSGWTTAQIVALSNPLTSTTSKNKSWLPFGIGGSSGGTTTTQTQQIVTGLPDLTQIIAAFGNTTPNSGNGGGGTV